VPTRFTILLMFAIAPLWLGCPEPDIERRSDFPEYGTRGGQWRSYAGDPQSSKYSPLDQIDASNFGRLQIAWTAESPAAPWRRDLMARKEAGEKLPKALRHPPPIMDFQVTPLMVDGTLFGVSNVGQVFALAAGTGRPLWTHDPEVWRSAAGFMQIYFAKQRGVTYWRDGDDERIIVPTFDAYLIALDARSGELIPSFGLQGRVDLMEGLRGPEIKRLDYFQSSPAALYRDTLIVGSSITDRPSRKRHTPGDVRGYDVRTGALQWVFHTIPERGELGTDSWENEAWRYTGAANVWGPMTVDPQLGLVYMTTSTPTNDLYGGHRRGDGLFAESLVALDALTGERRWHHQLIHHGLWDYDPAAAPNLIDITVEGNPVAAVAQVTKQGFVFVYDRETGEPVWAIEERPVPESDVPGEKTSPTQPFPTRPPPFERQGVGPDDLIDFTPALRAQALAAVAPYRMGPMFSPPSLVGTLTLPGPGGGANWQGAAIDPESGWLYVPSITSVAMLAVKRGKPGKRQRGFDYETADTPPLHVPMDAAPNAGLPITKPPWSRITAFDLNSGSLRWQQPNGAGPRDHPLLADLDLPRLGAGTRGCVLVTKTLVVASQGADIVMTNFGAPYLGAFDKTSGELVGEVRLPARSRGCPMTYLHAGVQYIVVAVGDADVAPQLVALALP
jgi:quinoprotein glucose dehydrogenase